ncbi:type II toxin-antitoxin system PemK/MazF family toxin [Treponema sp. OMZ 787]|uniref:type II toxin-antitoxin system PemK/MazF family toxin n=1 Tax=Treponema sp. OMZ 787 TaxID=2563669 RepID=UPI0020A4359F|nr:type II toxin-antitoxin system PemK/MazF family toxin [Treponema sp. OMZ 787]UTC62659.1 type II toxin-antitoxin system PemK/MazF family toxin [Treponema sp. OMZ 787]
MTHGEIWWVDFGIPTGSLPGYKRPVIIMQKESKLNTVLVIPLTTNLSAADYVPNIFLSKTTTKLNKDSVAVIHLMGAVNKFCCIEKISKINNIIYEQLVGAVNSFISTHQYGENQ